MTPDTTRLKFWATARKGWVLSIVVGLAILLIRFKALIPLVWGILVKNGTAHTIGNALDNLVLVAAIAGGCVLFVYAVRTGYRRTNQALELSNVAGHSQDNSDVALRTIAQLSLLINAPILYWAAFLFLLLPQLLKIPNASLRIGTTAALAGAFLAMAIIVVIATHIGIVLTKFSFRSVTKPPEFAAAVPANAGFAAYNQPVAYPQQEMYGQVGGYYPSPAPHIPPDNQQGAYGQSAAYPPQQNTYTQPESYPIAQPAAYYPATPQDMANIRPTNQTPGSSEPPRDTGQPWG